MSNSGFYPKEYENKTMNIFSNESSITFNDCSTYNSSTDNNIELFFKKASKKFVYLPPLGNTIKINESPFNIFNNSIEEFLNYNNISFENIYEINQNEKKEKYFKNFEVIYPIELKLFTHTKPRVIGDENYLNKKRYRSKQRTNRGRNTDNFRRMFKTEFLNGALPKKLNEILIEEGYNIKFDKFPHDFATDVSRKNCQKIYQMTLLEIYENKKLYKDIKMDNFYHNLHVVNILKKDKNYKFKKIFWMKFSRILEDYLTSDEFENNANSRKERLKLSELHYQRYIYHSKSFIKFCSN